MEAGRGALAEPPVGGREAVRDGLDRPYDHVEQKKLTLRGFPITKINTI